MAELLGTHSYQLDPKGRVSLPARFREAFADGAWLTIGQDGCLFAFPRAEWERRSDEVASSPLSDADGRAYARLFFGALRRGELDGQGRVTIPQRLREAVGISKDVVVLGVRRPHGDLGSRDLRALHGRFAGAYQAGDPRPQEERDDPERSSVPRSDRACRSSAMTALTLLASIGIGVARRATVG